MNFTENLISPGEGKNAFSNVFLDITVDVVKSVIQIVVMRVIRIKQYYDRE